jgi:hypothetical protein
MLDEHMDLVDCVVVAVAAAAVVVVVVVVAEIVVVAAVVLVAFAAVCVPVADIEACYVCASILVCRPNLIGDQQVDIQDLYYTALNEVAVKTA